MAGKSEYSFGKKKHGANPIQHVEFEKSNSNIKEKILAYYDKFTNLKTADENLNKIYNNMEKISKEIVYNLQLLQQKEKGEDAEILNQKIGNLTQLHNKLSAEFNSIMKYELKDLYQEYPLMYDKFIEGIDKETLYNVLTTIDDQQSGKITAKTAVNIGIKYTKDKYHLPDNFYDHESIKKIISNSEQTFNK